MRVPFVLHPFVCQHLVWSVFWILVILIGIQGYLIILICNLMVYNLEYLFTCLLPSIYLLWPVFYIFLLLSLCILDNSSLSNVTFANIFSESEVFLFSRQCFQGHKSLPYSRSLRFSPRSFIVLHIIFRYMIHLS